MTIYTQAIHQPSNGQGLEDRQGLLPRVLYRAWGLTAHRGRARLMFDRRSLIQAPNAPRGQSQQPRARNGHCIRQIGGTQPVSY